MRQRATQARALLRLATTSTQQTAATATASAGAANARPSATTANSAAAGSHAIQHVAAAARRRNGGARSVKAAGSTTSSASKAHREGGDNGNTSGSPSPTASAQTQPDPVRIHVLMRSIATPAMSSSSSAHHQRQAHLLAATTAESIGAGGYVSLASVAWDAFFAQGRPLLEHRSAAVPAPPAAAEVDEASANRAHAAVEEQTTHVESKAAAGQVSRDQEAREEIKAILRNAVVGRSATTADKKNGRNVKSKARAGGQAAAAPIVFVRGGDQLDAADLPAEWQLAAMDAAGVLQQGKGASGGGEEIKRAAEQIAEFVLTQVGSSSKQKQSGGKGQAQMTSQELQEEEGMNAIIDQVLGRHGEMESSTGLITDVSAGSTDGSAGAEGPMAIAVVHLDLDSFGSSRLTDLLVKLEERAAMRGEGAEGSVASAGEKVELVETIEEILRDVQMKAVRAVVAAQESDAVANEEEQQQQEDDREAWLWDAEQDALEEEPLEENAPTQLMPPRRLQRLTPEQFSTLVDRLANPGAVLELAGVATTSSGDQLADSKKVTSREQARLLTEQAWRREKEAAVAAAVERGENPSLAERLGAEAELLVLGEQAAAAASGAKKEQQKQQEDEKRNYYLDAAVGGPGSGFGSIGRPDPQWARGTASWLVLKGRPFQAPPAPVAEATAADATSVAQKAALAGAETKIDLTRDDLKYVSQVIEQRHGAERAARATATTPRRARTATFNVGGGRRLRRRQQRVGASSAARRTRTTSASRRSASPAYHNDANLMLSRAMVQNMLPASLQWDRIERQMDEALLQYAAATGKDAALPGAKVAPLPMVDVTKLNANLDEPPSVDSEQTVHMDSVRRKRRKKIRKHKYKKLRKEQRAQRQRLKK